MPTHTAPTVRSFRRETAIAALSVGILLLASCGTSEVSENVDRAATPAEETAASTTADAQQAGAAAQAFATAELADPAGEPRGTVELAEAEGGTLVTVEATGLPPGFHGLHIHTSGLCEPDSANPTEPGERGAFLSAGGHLAGPDGKAGHPEHAGDLPPLYVTDDGTGRIVALTDRLDRDLLLDADGSAAMIHEDSDNLANIPERYAPEGPDEDTRKAGDGGSRAACGVVIEQR
ncbi:superoxide dismutase family protein [Rhodococcus sp. IEGM 1408]|uniref:superoxide dismutase family protein n=1 Tax=Rhodococcus sp. IEGM 1408 TaxID=3082220 RepID=UPI002952F772|nr:superoxide dismutase family protein [Rhodococcus sp. IEGM 1408]MDV7999862.1 superoxide dismutase family protein [Rhodococcus sp. IEGM 1408]